MNDAHVAAELARLTEAVHGLRSDVGELGDKVDVTNGRVRRLEVWRAYLTGATTVLVVIALWLLNHVGTIEVSALK